MWPNPYSNYGIIEFKIKSSFTIIQQINSLGRVVKCMPDSNMKRELITYRLAVITCHQVSIS
jgi:hypothetical protein